MSYAVVSRAYIEVALAAVGTVTGTGALIAGAAAVAAQGAVQSATRRTTPSAFAFDQSEFSQRSGQRTDRRPINTGGGRRPGDRQPGSLRYNR
jgi:hypothetical protein